MVKYKQDLLNNNFLIEFCKQEQVSMLALFGSFQRDEAKETSDIDFIVKFNNMPSLIKFSDMTYRLEKNLGRHVDLLTIDSINPYIKAEILNSMEVIYSEE